MSAVITLGIVVMWAVVLVPMWLHRHDRTDEVQSVDRFGRAMRVLSRRGSSVGDHRWVVMPARAAALTGAVASVKGGMPKRTRRSADRAPARVASTGRGGGSAAPVSRQVRRRRRTLATLAVLAVLTVVAAVAVGGPLLYLQVASDALLVAGLVRTRQLVTAERRRRAVRARRDARLRSQLAAVVGTELPENAYLHRSAEPESVADRRYGSNPRRAGAAEAESVEPLAATGTSGPEVAQRPAPRRAAPSVTATPATATPATATPVQARTRVSPASAGAGTDPLSPVVRRGTGRVADRPARSGPNDADVTADLGRLDLAVEAALAEPTRPAPARRRVFDLTRPGQFSEGRAPIIDEDVDPAAETAADDGLLDSILERRRAANG